MNITARNDDLTIKGSTVEGKNVNLKAAGNVELEASENTNKSNQDSKSSGWNVGATIGLHGGIGVNAGANKGKDEIKENGTTYKQTEVTAQATLNVESGKDTNIIGSKASGEIVKITAGENLNIESLPDKESYNEKNSSSGFNISSNITDKGLDKAKITGGGTIDSNYESVIDQA